MSKSKDILDDLYGVVDQGVDEGDSIFAPTVSATGLDYSEMTSGSPGGGKGKKKRNKKKGKRKGNANNGTGVCVSAGADAVDRAGAGGGRSGGAGVGSDDWFTPELLKSMRARELKQLLKDRVGLAWGWHGVGMTGVGMGPHGVGMGLAWGWHANPMRPHSSGFSAGTPVTTSRAALKSTQRASQFLTSNGGPGPGCGCNM